MKLVTGKNQDPEIELVELSEADKKRLKVAQARRLRAEKERLAGFKEAMAEASRKAEKTLAPWFADDGKRARKDPAKFERVFKNVQKSNELSLRLWRPPIRRYEPRKLPRLRPSGVLEFREPFGPFVGPLTAAQRGVRDFRAPRTTFSAVAANPNPGSLKITQRIRGDASGIFAGLVGPILDQCAGHDWISFQLRRPAQRLDIVAEVVFAENNQRSEGSTNLGFSAAYFNKEFGIDSVCDVLLPDAGSEPLHQYDRVAAGTRHDYFSSDDFHTNEVAIAPGTRIAPGLVGTTGPLPAGSIVMISIGLFSYQDMGVRGYEFIAAQSIRIDLERILVYLNNDQDA